MTSSRTNHWQGQSGQWERITSPLRPHQDDVALFISALAAPVRHCLLLGVTPELVPLAPSLIAVDNNAGMVQKLWQSHPEGCQVMLGDWLALPFEPNTFDRVMGDGCTTVLEYPRQFVDLFGQLTHCLEAKGRLILRIFARPEIAETPEAACAAAMAGEIGNFHSFKWRLAMAMASENERTNLPVAEIHARFNQLLPDRAALAAASGWELADIGTIDVYQGATANYSFPTLAQVQAALPPQLKVIDVLYGQYELADCCPMVVLEHHP